jgi:hypothetical protein
MPATIMPDPHICIIMFVPGGVRTLCAEARSRRPEATLWDLERYSMTSYV